MPPTAAKKWSTPPQKPSAPPSRSTLRERAGLKHD
jgi:hypothetical protein